MADDVAPLEPDKAPDQAPLPPPVPEPTEADQQSEAAGAREAAGRTPRRRAEQPAEAPSPAAPTGDGNPYAQFATDPKDNGIDLMERQRINRQEAFYRGSIAGSSRLATMAHIASTPDGPDVTPERRKVNDDLRKEFVGIKADLAAYDNMKPWGTTLEAATSLAGQLEGTMISPESWIGWGAKGATWVGRTLRAGLQQGAIQGAVDPVVQGLNIGAGIQDSYDPMRTATATALGSIIGSSAHVIGEGAGRVIGQGMLRREMNQLAEQDAAFESDILGRRMAQDLEQGTDRGEVPASPAEATSPEVTPEAQRAKASEREGTATAAEPAKAEGTEPIERGFSDAVADERVKLANSQGAVREKGLNERARHQAFEGEAGEHLQRLVDRYGMDPTTVRLSNLYKHYDRQPGQSVDYALEEAIGRWDSAEERAAIQTVHDPEMDRELAEWARQYDLESGRSSDRDLHQDSTQFGRFERTLPGTSGVFRTYSPHHIPIEEEIPFEHTLSEPHEAEGSHPAPGSDAQPGTGQGVAGGGEGAPVGGERGAGRPNSESRAAASAEGIGPEQRRSGPSERSQSGEPELEAIAQRRMGGKLGDEQDRATTVGPSPQASPAQDIAIRSLQQQSMDLAKALDIPVREGRVQIKNAGGTFNTRTGVVRVREVPDFEIVAHEAGHAIEKKAGPQLTALTQRHGFEMMALDYDQGPQGRRVNEGFAEWVRRYIGNPAHAEQVAPNFTADFRQYMGAEHPDILSSLDKAAETYRAYLQAPSVDAVGAVRRTVDENPKGFAKVRSDVKEQGLPLVIKSAIQSIYTGLMDNNAPVTRAVRELALAIREKTGAPLDLKAADNPDILFRLSKRSQQGAVRSMMDGVYPYHEITPSGPSLANAITTATGKASVWGKWEPEALAQFDNYLIARRAEFLWRKFDAGDLPNPPAAFSRADAITAMADLEKLNPNLRNASDMVHGYSRELLRKRFDAGLIDRDLYDKLLAEEFYVPFMRDMSDKPGAGGGAGGAEGPGTVQTVRRMVGSSRDIKSPLESLMMQTFLVERTIKDNDVWNALADLGAKAGTEGGKYIEEIPAHEARKLTTDVSAILEEKARSAGMTANDAKIFVSDIGNTLGEDPILGSYFKMEQTKARGEPIVFTKRGGNLKAYRVMSEKEGHALYETLTQAPEPVTDVWLQVVGASSTLLRSTITTNPTFAISNYIRDQVAASILRSDYVPFVSGARGIADEVLQRDSAKHYALAGGVAGGAATGPVEHAIEADINALAKQGYAVQRLTSIKGVLELASITEAGTRNSIFGKVFEAKKLQGLSDYEAMTEAAFQAQDMLDFSRHGSRTMAIRTLLPFLNAHMQGLDKAKRALLDPIYNRVRSGVVFVKDSADFKNAMVGLTKFAGIGGALGAMGAAISWEKEGYRDASTYLKGTNFVIPLGGKLLVVPKPFELSIGYTAGEYAYARLAKDDPRAARQFAEAAWQSLQPPNPFTDLPLLSPVASLMYGKNSLTGADIVPGALQRLPPEQQYNDRTSEVAKSLGSMTGLSPMKIDYGIGAVFGTWGRDVMALSQGLNEDSPAKSFDNSVFLRRFIKDPTSSSDIVTKFWDFMGQTTGKYNQAVAGYDALTKGFADPARGQAYLDKLPSAERAFVTLKSAGNEDGKAAFNADEKRLHPLQRAYDAVSLLGNLRRELSDNSFRDFETLTRLKLDPEKRRDLISNIRELSQMEMRNALVIMKEPGYEGRPVLDTRDTMDKIQNLSPEIAKEVATRYATARIYTTASVQAAWPRLRDELVHNGSDADIKDLSLDAKADGYEFSGERVRRPVKRRVQMSGASP